MIPENKKEFKRPYDFSNLSTEDINTIDYNKFVGKFKGIKVFSSLPQNAEFVLQLGRLSKLRRFMKDQTIFERGEPAAIFCIILTGSIGFMLDNIEEVAHTKVKRGFFGEYELLFSMPR